MRILIVSQKQSSRRALKGLEFLSSGMYLKEKYKSAELITGSYSHHTRCSLLQLGTGWIWKDLDLTLQPLWEPEAILLHDLRRSVNLNLISG